MKVTVFLFLSLFTSSVFSESRDFNCVFDKWFDSPIDTNVFFSLTETEKDKTYIDNNGRKWLSLFENNETISLVHNPNYEEVEVIVINKTNTKITKSKTMDDLVTVIKGNCEYSYSKEISSEQLVERQGLKYEINSIIPFTGTVTHSQ